jgi:ribose transport system substrate-binding protein
VTGRHPGLEIIYQQPGDYKRSPAKRVMEDALQSLSQIDAVYAHNDEMAIGAYLAARAVDREDDMIFVGIDGQGEAVQMIREGKLHATFIYPNGSEQAIEYGVRILNGDTVPKDISLGTTRVTRDEAPEYQGF